MKAGSLVAKFIEYATSLLLNLYMLISFDLHGFLVNFSQGVHPTHIVESLHFYHSLIFSRIFRPLELSNLQKSFHIDEN